MTGERPQGASVEDSQMAGEDAVLEVEAHRKALNGVLARYGLPPETLLLVPSVQKWEANQGIADGNPFRLAMAYLPSRTIVMQAMMDANFLGTTSTLFYIGTENYLWVIETDLRALKHLLLHEIAHLRGMLSEAEADQWALEELRAVEVTRQGEDTSS